jgi:hypothetical protein
LPRGAHLTDKSFAKFESDNRAFTNMQCIPRAQLQPSFLVFHNDLIKRALSSLQLFANGLQAVMQCFLTVGIFQGALNGLKADRGSPRLFSSFTVSLCSVNDLIAKHDDFFFVF